MHNLQPGLVAEAVLLRQHRLYHKIIQKAYVHYYRVFTALHLPCNQTLLLTWLDQVHCFELQPVSVLLNMSTSVLSYSMRLTPQP